VHHLTVPRNRLQTWFKIFATVLLAVLALLSLKSKHISAQDLPSGVGRIEGDDVQVVTTTPAGVETNAAPTVVASGSDITLRSGHALLSLDAGGEISVCGPAHFKLLQSAGAVTLALDYGRVHPSLDSTETFTIYTPTIIATPISISGGSRDTTLGLGQNGEMCVLTAHGAMRVEPQFSDQSLIVPQGGTATLVGGQIESLHGEVSACSCDYPRASAPRPQPSGPQPSVPRPEISALSRAPEQKRTITDDSAQPAAPAEGPIYTVLMPPLSFDANAPARPPEPSPETILLVREVRLNPSVVFHGHVNPAPPQEAAVVPIAPAPQKQAEPPHAESQPGILDRMRNFFRKLTGRGPCAGPGCNG
jgi:hypothetical protein